MSDTQTVSFMENIQTQNEGLMLALQANAEALQKMDKYFEKMDEEHEEVKEKEREEEMQKSKESLVKEISFATLELMKKENMELNADKFHQVSHGDVFGRKMGDEDAQVDVEGKLRTDTGEVQKPIQAMLKSISAEDYISLQKHFLKEHASLYEGDDKNGEEDVIPGVEDVEEDVMTDGGDEELDVEGDMEEDVDLVSKNWGMAKRGDHDEDDWESTDYPMDEDDMDKMYKSMKGMSKRELFKAMLKKQQTIKSNVKSEAQKLSEKSLQKQGFTKEISRSPRVIKKDSLGLDNTIVKSKKGEETDLMKEVKDLSNPELYSYRDLINMRDGTDKPLLTPELLEFYS